MILLAAADGAIRIASFAQAAKDYFGNVGPALSRLFGIPGLKLDTRLTSLLAFVYTYHYLNWFIKADVIRWADIPRARLALVIAASAGSTALYFYDYAFGFTFLLALSLVHILLEFPLNSLAVRQLGAAAAGSLRGRGTCGTARAPPTPCPPQGFEATLTLGIVIDGDVPITFFPVLAQQRDDRADEVTRGRSRDGAADRWRRPCGHRDRPPRSPRPYIAGRTR